MIRLFLWFCALVLALTVLPVALLRVLPPPTTAFMLQSPVKPVHYQWVPKEKISDNMRRAVVASEDQKFWTHQGFDLEAIEKARIHNEKSRRKRGASTISQQTAKNLFLWSGGGYFRKGIEAGYTVLIEALWTKQRILEVYLNIAEFGPGIYGVEAASQAYFHKPAAKLSAGEAAKLAAVLPSPRRWKVLQPGPYVAARGAWILRQMGHRGAVPSTEPEPEIPEAEQRELDAEAAGEYWYDDATPAATLPPAAPGEGTMTIEASPYGTAPAASDLEVAPSPVPAAPALDPDPAIDPAPTPSPASAEPAIEPEPESSPAP